MQATDFQHSPACNGEEMKHYMQSGSHMLGCGFVPAVIFSFQKVYSNVKVMTNYILITLYIFFTVLNSLNFIQLGSTMHVIICTLGLVGLATRVSVVLGTCLHYVGGWGGGGGGGCLLSEERLIQWFKKLGDPTSKAKKIYCGLLLS